MNFVIFSYREEYRHTCGRSCSCLRERNSSTFSVETVDSEEGAAHLLASHLLADESAEFVNLVFVGWSHVVDYAQFHSTSPKKGLDSIQVHAASPSYDEGEDSDAVLAEEKRVGELHERLIGLTRGRLAELKKAQADEADVKAAKERAEETERQLREKRRQLAQLKAELGETS